MMPPWTVISVIILAAGWLTRECATSTTKANLTQAALVDEEDASSSEEIDITEFKERYRRLIPYMTFYVANNNINSQTASPQNFARPYQNTVRRPQYVLARPINAPQKTPNVHVSPLLQQEKFIPSVQYDPKDFGIDNDYFTPLRYDVRPNYDDYSVPLYENYQSPRPAFPELTTLKNHMEDQYFTTTRPILHNNVLQYNANLVTVKPNRKPVNVNTNLDYPSGNYGRPTGKPIVNSDFVYPEEEYEPIRYISSSASRVPQPFRLSELPSPRHPSAFPLNPNINLSHIVKGLQLTNRLPETLNADNIDSSIKTLVEILSILNSGKNELPLLQASQLPKAAQTFPNYDDFESQYQATSAPIVVPDVPQQFDESPFYEKPIKPALLSSPNRLTSKLNTVKTIEYYTPRVQDLGSEEQKVKYKLKVKPVKVQKPTQGIYEITENLPSNVLEDEKFTLPLTTEAPARNYPAPYGVTTHTQNFPPTSLKYGATRGKPNVDYPAYVTIPKTDFSCKEQRYKGFFGDPATGCQVWHYCDLNGGKASFLCPNGTIFSQVALTCDWWFNVKCESTTQLYVLNERLYKYILPVMPKFPEDFTGPEVDRYLELKFKEMEAKLKEKKLKKQKEEKDKAKNKFQADKDLEYHTTD